MPSNPTTQQDPVKEKTDARILIAALRDYADVRARPQALIQRASELADAINEKRLTLAENKQQARIEELEGEIERLREITNTTIAGQQADVERYAAALDNLAGDHGCTLLEPADPSEPSTGTSCRDRRHEKPGEWCYACIAHEALHGPSEPPYAEYEAALSPTQPDAPEGENDGE